MDSKPLLCYRYRPSSGRAQELIIINGLIGYLLLSSGIVFIFPLQALVILPARVAMQGYVPDSSLRSGDLLCN